MTRALATLSTDMLLAGDFDHMLKRAAVLVKSGLLPASVDSPEKAAIIVLTGAEIGIGPMKALRNLYVVNGKVDFQAPLVLELVENMYGSNALVYLSNKSDDKKAVVRVMKPGWDEPQYVTFTWDEAHKAGLTNKAVWKQYPQDMLASRAITRAARRYFSAALGGAAYTPEEIGRDNEWRPEWKELPDDETVEIDGETVERVTGEIVEDDDTDHKPPGDDAEFLNVARHFANFFGLDPIDSGKEPWSKHDLDGRKRLLYKNIQTRLIEAIENQQSHDSLDALMADWHDISLNGVYVWNDKVREAYEQQQEAIASEA